MWVVLRWLELRFDGCTLYFYFFTLEPNNLPNIPDAHEEWGEAVALDLLLLTAPEVEVVDGSYTTVKGIAFMAYLV
jgi:hypothetical protein